MKRKYTLHLKCVIEYRKDVPCWGYNGDFVFHKKHDFETHEEAEKFYDEVMNG
jgi:hypothetical protein